MKKLFVFCVALGGLSLLSTSAIATPTAPELAVNDTVRFLDGGANNSSQGGGEFVVQELINGSWVDRYISFCLEINQHIAYKTEYNIDSISDRAYGGGTDNDNNGPGDPISSKTAFLYQNFYDGTLAEYNYGTDLYADGVHNNTDNTFAFSRDESAHELQDAIWYFEDEIKSATGNFYVDLALANESNWTGLGNVQAMNISSSDDSDNQSQLTVAPVPEPATIFLLGIGLVGLAGAANRRKTK